MTNRATPTIPNRPSPPHPWPAYLWVLAAYLLLTVLMTWPTARHLTTAIPGDGFDGWQNYWNLWWVKEALLVHGSNPYYTDYLYPPAGTNLLFHTLNIFNGLWTLPIQLNAGLAPAYNSVVFLSFVLAGYGGYLLSLYTLTRLKFGGRAGLRGAAFVGGLIFTMSPFHMAHLLGHMQVFSMIWPPFYILWLLRALDIWADRPRYSWRSAGLASISLILAALVDWYHALYLLIFTGLVLIWSLIRQGLRLRLRERAAAIQSGPENSPPQAPYALRLTSFSHWPFALDHPLLQPIWIVLAIGLSFAVTLSPLLWPMVREASQRPDLQTGLVQNVTLSADLLAFVTPSELHPLWGDWARRIADNFSSTTSERLIFAGFVPLILGGVAIIRGWHRAIVKFWTLTVALFFILALGPFLHVGGRVVSLGGWPVPMPYLLFFHTVPFIGLTRSLSRYDLMVMLGLGMLASVGIQLVMSNEQLTTGGEKRPNKRRGGIYKAGVVPVVVAVLVCFEFWVAPYPVSQVDTPRFYAEIGADAEDYVIAELPMNWDRPTPLLHQVTHGKRLLTAYTSRDNPKELAWRTPVFQHWRHLGPDIIDQPLPEIAPTIFFDFNLRYIVLDYWQMPPGPEREATEQWVAAALPDAAPIYDDGRLVVFQTPPKGETEPYLTLGSGWGDRQTGHAIPVSRSFRTGPDRQPELFLHHPQEQPLILGITAASPVAQELTVFADGEPVGQLNVTPDLSTHELALPALARQIVKLRLRSENPAGPVTVTRLSLQQGAGQ